MRKNMLGAVVIASVVIGGVAVAEDFASEKCGVAGEPTKAAKPQPGAAVEKEYYKKLNASLDVASLNKDCGTKITVEYDKSWHGHWTDEGVGVPGIPSGDQSNCMQLISQIRGRCAKPEGKKAVAAKIKKISCAYQAKEGTSVKLTGTSLVGGIGPWSCQSDISDPANKLLDTL
ncbi:MAG TPA: hypothetical protein VGM90_04225 [Kofleriaceae bacterium]|jgi:hypothetical protein